MSDALNEEMKQDWLTVAEAAGHMNTTIPRLRRLLARPEMSACSRQEAIQTKRGTRTSTVVLVSELDALKAALSMGTAPPGLQEQKQEHLRTFSETEVLALQTTLRRTEELLQSKDNELAAKDEIILLLREKIEGLNRPALPIAVQEREQERSSIVSEKIPAEDSAIQSASSANAKAVTNDNLPNSKPETAWARVIRLFGRSQT